MSFDEFLSAGGSSKRADHRAGLQADGSPNAVRRRSTGSDEPAHQDGRLPTVRDADRRVSGCELDSSTGALLAIERESGLAEFLADAYVVTDSAGVIQGANTAASELFGQRHQSLRGTPLAELLVSTDRASFRSRLRRLATGHAGMNRAAWTLRLRTASRGKLESHARARVVRDAAGDIQFVRWLLHPVEDTGPESDSPVESSGPSPSVAARHVSRYSRIVREAATLLSRSFDLEETLSAMARLALPSLGDHCWVDVIEYEGDISRLHVARKASESTEHDPALAIAPSAHNESNAVISVLESGTPLLEPELTPDLLRALAVSDDQYRALEALHARSVLIVPMIARSRVLGALTFIATGPHRPHRTDDLALAEDLAQRAGLAADNARLYAMAQGASRAKDEFMASMSHELRTPLTAIIGYTELLGDEIVGPLNATQREQLSRIRASGNLLLALVDQILDLARVDAGKHAPRVAEVSAAAVVEQVVMLTTSQVRQKNLALTVKAPPPDVELVTDPLWLRQILVNLLSNAVKFTERGEVGISAVRDGDRVSFEVWDTGIGIPAKYIDRIYDPFWQAEQQMTRRYGGAGVGLAVAHRLCTLLGGDISVSSTPGAGSRFTVSLPAKARH